jgi:hypothetical protein
VQTETALSRREATLRSAATMSLTGIALVQATEMPPLLAQGRQLAVLSLAATGLCVGLAWKLAASSADAAVRVWRVVAATAVLVLAGWGALHAFGLPGLASDRGDWGSLPGIVCVVLATACLAISIVATRPTRAAVRGVAAAFAVALALAPPAAVLLVALGPGASGGESVLASGGHIHSHGSPEAAIVFQPLPGGHGGHYVYKAKAIPHQTTFTFGLIASAAFVFTYGAVVYLRRRTAPAESLGLGVIDGRLA